MLTLLGSHQRFCDGINRRAFLRIGAFGAGLTLADLLRRRATAEPATPAPKSAIMIYLQGGPSHIDMYDMKPDAPAEFRGEFRPIPTNVPGVHICEHMPLQAKMWDKLAVVRSVIPSQEHADVYVSTGYPQLTNRLAHHPSFGAVVSRLRGVQRGVPPFVSLRGLSEGLEPGFLGVAHRAFTTSGPGMRNLSFATGVTPQRVADRMALLSTFDTLRRDLDASGTMTGLDDFNARAFDMVASGAVRDALDLTREDAGSRERYQGIEQFLTARRLVEAGVGCVTLTCGSSNWDTHSDNFKILRRQLPEVDRGVANLIQDLHDRGMENDVVTVMWGEFGRTPKVGDATPDGRGHWPQVMSALVAGGGLKMGQAVGSTTARAEMPKDRPYSVARVLATLYRAIGIDPGEQFPDSTGRPIHILDDRDPVAELL